MERESDHVPECKPVGHPSYALDEIAVLKMLSQMQADFLFAAAKERDAFSQSSIIAAGYLSEYIADRLEAYGKVLAS